MNIGSLGLFLALFVSVMRLSAATLVYQPSPYKGKDIWISSYYSYNDDYGVNDGRLRVGGWGDWYNSVLKFDIEGLPKNPTQVVLALYPLPANDGSTTVSSNVWRLTNSWDENSGWRNTVWTGYKLGTIPAPSNHVWQGMIITSTYNLWKSDPATNQGIMLAPTANNNRLNNYLSSDYETKGYRPYLHITYDETVTAPNFKLPLPGGRRWMVTTEVGSGDAKNPSEVLSSHTGVNYFSLDFSTQSLPAYSGPIPIYASAAGRVIVATYNQFNGNHVVIDHDYDGKENTGFTTRYLHFSNLPVVSAGQYVAQGQLLGYMGNTGEVINGGVHLHFGIRYNGSGASSVNELSFVKLEGWHMKQFQTEVDSAGNRNINSYYTSTNTP